MNKSQNVLQNNSQNNINNKLISMNDINNINSQGNNKEGNNRNSKNNMFINNYVNNTQKRLQDNDNQMKIININNNNHDRDYSKIELKDNSKHPSSHFSNFNSEARTKSLNIELDDNEKMSYLTYFFNDIICCRSRFALHMKAVSKIISFENLLEVNYEYILKSNLG